MVQGQLTSAVQATRAAHQRALATFDRTLTTADAAAGLGELVGLYRRATALAREIEVQVAEYGRPAPLAGAFARVEADPAWNEKLREA